MRIATSPKTSLAIVLVLSIQEKNLITILGGKQAETDVSPLKGECFSAVFTMPRRIDSTGIPLRVPFR